MTEAKSISIGQETSVNHSRILDENRQRHADAIVVFMQDFLIG